MNVRYYLVPCFEDFSVRGFESFGIASSSIRKYSIVELHKFFANWFFMNEKWINIFKNFSNLYCCHKPNKLVLVVFIVFAFLVKTKSSSKSFHQPFKHWKLSIIERKASFISRIRSIFRLIFLNHKAAFSINESSKIGIISSSWCYSFFELFKISWMVTRNKILIVLNVFHFFYYIESLLSASAVEKINKQLSFFTFFNNIRQHLLNKWNSFELSQSIVMHAFLSIRDIVIRYYSSTIVILEPFKDQSVYRSNDNDHSEFWRQSSIWMSLSNVKASISIKITSKISNGVISVFFHGINIVETALKSISNRFSDNPTDITRDDVNEIVRTLVGSDAKTLTEGIDGENRFGTAPVRDAFFAMAHTDLLSNLDGVAGFLHKTAYPAPMRGLPSEWGTVGNLRFLLSSVGSVDTAKSHLGADVYNIFCVGQEAYGCVKQDGYTASFIYRDPMYDGPLAQNSTVGFKMAQVPRILNDLWVLNLRTTLA